MLNESVIGSFVSIKFNILLKGLTSEEEMLVLRNKFTKTLKMVMGSWGRNNSLLYIMSNL